jgi:uncharacterized delta-60 repeat protein
MGIKAAGGFIVAVTGVLATASTAAAAPAPPQQPAPIVAVSASATTHEGDTVVVGSAGYFRRGTTDPCNWSQADPDCSDTRPIVAEFRAGGTIDSSFGEGKGYTLLGAGGSIYTPGYPPPGDVVVAPDGAIVLYTTAYGGAGQLIRLTADGRLDTSFADNGVAELPDSFYTWKAADTLAVDSMGRTLLVGSSGVLRLTASGEPDPSFGVDGLARVPVGTAVLTLRPDDRALVIGSGSTNSGEPAVTAVQLDTNGAPDTSFGNDGVSATPIPDPGTDPPYGSYYYAGHAISLDDDGRAVVLLERDPYLPDVHFRCGDDRVVRLSSTGTLDTAFGADGFASPLGWACAADAQLLGADELYFVSTRMDYSSPNYLIESALGNDGQAATGFAPPALSLQVVGRSTIATSVSQLPDGTVVTAGTANGLGFLLAQRPNGQVDTSFGTNGLATLPAARICSTPFEFCGYPYRPEFTRLARKGIGRSIDVSGRGLHMRFTCLREIQEACEVRAFVTLSGTNRRVTKFPTLDIDPHRRQTAGAVIRNHTHAAVTAASHLDIQATFVAAHQEPVHVTRRVKIHAN